ncbi:MAG: tRNA uridine-5-carboxymethylaminomethyl(34) synthesis GTPase MnmE [Erysipelotrichaceae bacterium]|nr:tRNA uridine-5-carboxymethylaminomethyl(34) synthesis GTPase MnmE [Erysipelotrichaceae bacterium]
MDTIAAISTVQGEGAISIIRISGDEAIPVTEKILDRKINDMKGYRIRHAYVMDEKGIVDEVLISMFRAPHSYTGEDSIEISCHGGIYITRKILSLVLGAGARMARRGEFTERAFLNGKMDLAQAEGVADLIHARDDMNARSAVHSLGGSVKKILDPLIEELVQIIAQIEVNIDYPEYDDVEVLRDEQILPLAKRWISQMDELIDTASKAVSVRTGIDTVIVGKPNVGKSSLLNALLEEDKAIVTEIAGTTRDLVEGTVRIGDLTLNLIDTAGIRDSDDRIEQMGIERSLKALEKAELVIVVLDASRELDEEDRQLLAMTENRERIVIYNKKDRAEIPDTIAVSARENDLDALKQALQEKYANGIQAAYQDTLNNERQIGLAMQARQHMKDAVQAMEAGMETDLVTIDLQASWDALKEITGEATRDGLLDEIFSRFCLGK